MIRTGFLSHQQALDFILATVSEAWPNLKPQADQVSFSDDLLCKDELFSEEDAKFELVDLNIKPDFGIIIPYMGPTGHKNYACKIWVPEHRSELIASGVIRGKKSA